jgi:sodium/proline symporter
VIAALYWRRTTRVAALAAMLVTTVVWLVMFTAAGFGADRKFLVFGMLPVATLVAVCTVTVVVVSLCTRPPSDHLLAKFFPLKTTPS